MSRPDDLVLDVFTGELPYLTTEQMREVDRLMMEDFKIDLVRMMDNAGRNLADLARRRFFDGDPQGKKIAVLAGAGGNGGSLVCARWLHNHGDQVRGFIARPDEKFTPVPAHPLDILRQMRVDVSQAGDLDAAEHPDLVIGGVIGYSLLGAPRGSAAKIIRWANAQGVPILSWMHPPASTPPPAPSQTPPAPRRP